MVLLHHPCVFPPETRLSKRDMAKARYEMVETCLGPHILDVSDPVLTILLRNRLDRQSLLANLVLKTLKVLVCLNLEVELAKDRHNKLLSFHLW